MHRVSTVISPSESAFVVKAFYDEGGSSAI